MNISFCLIDRRKRRIQNRFVVNELVGQCYNVNLNKTLVRLFNDFLFGKKMDTEIRDIVTAAADFATADSPPADSELYTDIYKVA